MVSIVAERPRSIKGPGCNRLRPIRIRRTLPKELDVVRHRHCSDVQREISMRYDEVRFGILATACSGQKQRERVEGCVSRPDDTATGNRSVQDAACRLRIPRTLLTL